MVITGGPSQGISKEQMEERLRPIEEKLDKILETLGKLIDYQKKTTSIILRMNERDCNREELYEALDKLSKEGFFFPSKPDDF